MDNLRYINNVTTLAYDRDRCIGCGMCATVCPRRVMTIQDHKAQITDRDGCIECGACTLNCPTNALTVTPGVGCAAYIIQVWLKGADKASCGSGCC